MTTPSPRTISRSLSGFLCGTHSGALRSRRGDRLRLDVAAAAHQALEPSPSGVPLELGRDRWAPDGHANQLLRRLTTALDHEHVIELVLFGSQARGATTGFSDVDAILVITEAAAERPALLKKLRPRVLAAQRAVLAHQPMQHHGFEVTTPRLLNRAEESFALPRVALEETCSLRGRAVLARFGARGGLAALASLGDLVDRVLGAESWPSHPWRAHRLVSMFELLPTLYLQSQGKAVPKWRSFAEAKVDFGADWWPYNVLREVRSAWPLVSGHALNTASVMVRNPWLAVELWSRLPASAPERVRDLLSSDCLHGLRKLAGRMLESVR